MDALCSKSMVMEFCSKFKYLTLEGYYLNGCSHIKTDSKKIILAQKCTNNKKSTTLVQYPSNLVKMISPWVGNIAKILAKSE